MSTTPATDGKVLHIERWYTRSELARSLGISLPELRRRLERGEIVARDSEHGRRYRLATTQDADLEGPRAEAPVAALTTRPLSPPAAPSASPALLGELFEVAREALEQRDAAEARLQRARDEARAERRALQAQLEEARAERERARLEAESLQRSLRDTSQRAQLRAQQHLTLAREVLAIASELAEGRPSRKRRKELAWRLARLRDSTTPRLQSRRATEHA